MLGAAATAPGSPSLAYWPSGAMLANIRARAVTFSVLIHFVRVSLNWQLTSGMVRVAKTMNTSFIIARLLRSLLD